MKPGALKLPVEWVKLAARSMTLADNGVAPAGFRRPLPAANSGVPTITNTIYRVRPTTSCCGDLGVRIN